MISTTDLDRPLPEGMFVEAAVGATVMCWLFIRAAAATEWRRILSFGERMPQEVSTDVSKTGERAVSIWTSGGHAFSLGLGPLAPDGGGVGSDQPADIDGGNSVLLKQLLRVLGIHGAKMWSCVVYLRVYICAYACMSM